MTLFFGDIIGMKLFKFAALLAAAALFALACDNTTGTNPNANRGANASPAISPAASPTPTTDEFARARVIYGQECSICHGEDAKGGIVKVEGKRLKVPSLTEGHALNHSNEELAKQISKGGDGMPAFKDKMSEDEINQMVRFIRQQFQGKTDNAGNANQGSMPGMKD